MAVHGTGGDHRIGGQSQPGSPFCGNPAHRRISRKGFLSHPSGERHQQRIHCVEELNRGQTAPGSVPQSFVSCGAAAEFDLAPCQKGSDPVTVFHKRKGFGTDFGIDLQHMEDFAPEPFAGVVFA